MLATTTNLNRFLNKAERIIRNDYNEKGLIVCARIDNVFAINYNDIPFILSVNVAPFNVIVYSIALSSDSKNYIIKSRGTCGNQEDVISDIYVDLLHYVRDNNICLETEKHYADYTSEETVKDVMEVKQDLNTRFGEKEQQYFDTDCLELNNPNWHHVSSATLANIDNDMLDEKRRHYMKVYRMTANVINSIYKCNKLTSIDKLRTNLIQTVRTMAKNEKIEWALVQYVKAKIDNCYLVNGLQSSFYSKTYGYNKSRSYTKTFFI